MTKLSDTQAILLSTAAQRDTLSILPLPATVEASGAGKVITALIKRGLRRIAARKRIGRSPPSSALRSAKRMRRRSQAITKEVMKIGRARNIAVRRLLIWYSGWVQRGQFCYGQVLKYVDFR